MPDTAGRRLPATALLAALGANLLLGPLALVGSAVRAQDAGLLLLPPPPPAPQAFRGSDPLTGPRSRLGRDWVGLRPLPPETPILVMAGHADSQNMAGAGTSGEAVGLRGASAMYPGITDELYWAMVIATAVERLGQERGLNIRYYRPPWRTIADGNAPGTNWSEGRDHVAAGGYALEIHFDAYGGDGIGSGLIPPVTAPNSLLDEALASEFGGYPRTFRDILGGPRRGIALLEIGKLEGSLEASLRNPATRDQTVQTIATRVVRALEAGLGRSGQATSVRPVLPSEPPPQRRPSTADSGRWGFQ